MADTDLIFKLIAQDEAKQKLEEARAEFDKMTQAEKESVKASYEAQQADKALAESKQTVIEAIEKSGSAGEKYVSQLNDLQRQYDDGKITQEQFSEGLQSLKKSIDDAGESGTRWIQSLTDLKSGLDIAGMVLDKFKQAWNFAKEGAAVQRIGQQFNQVASDFGVNADELVKAMDKAARGTVDDEELMQTATRALTQGVITSAGDLTKFVEIARASAVRFGGDTTQALQSILYATEVGAQRQLKATIGVVDFTKSYDDLATKLGKRKQDLTEEEQLQARVNTVLDKGAELVKKVGDAGDDAATKMARFETKVKDLEDQAKSTATNALTPVVDSLYAQQVYLDRNATEVEKLKATYEAWKSAGSATADELARMKVVIDELEKKEAALSRTTEETAVRMGMGKIAALEYTEGIGNASDAMASRYQAWGDSVVKANNLALQSIDILKISMAGAVTKELESFTNKQDDLQKKAEKVKEELDKLEKSQGAVATSTKKHGLSAAEAALAQLQLAKAQSELDAENAKGTLSAEQLAAAQAKVLENKQKLEGATRKEIENNGQLRAASEALKTAQSELANNTDPMKQAELAVKVENLKDKLGQATGAVISYIDNSKKIKELQGQYDDLNKEIAENAMEHTKATRQILFNIAAQQLETIKDPQVRAKAMNELALQWQLVDKATYESTTKIIGYVDQLAKDKNIDAFVHNVQGVDSAVRGLPNQIADSVTATKNEMKELKAEPVEVKVGVDKDGAKKSLEDTRTELKNQALQGDVVIPVTYKVMTITTDQTSAERDKQQQARDESAAKRITDTGTVAKKVSDDLGVAGKSALDALGTQATQQEEKVRTTGMNVLQMFKDTTTNFSGLVTNATNTANLAVGSLLTNILKAEGVHIVEFKVKVTGDEIPRIPSGGGGNIPELQHGGPVRAEGLYRLHPDEYVLSALMRHGQQPIPQQAIPIARGGGDTTINNNNFYDGASTKLWLEKQRLDRVQSVLEAM